MAGDGASLRELFSSERARRDQERDDSYQRMMNTPCDDPANAEPHAYTVSAGDVSPAVVRHSHAWWEVQHQAAIHGDGPDPAAEGDAAHDPALRTWVTGHTHDSI